MHVVHYLLVLLLPLLPTTISALPDPYPNDLNKRHGDWQHCLSDDEAHDLIVRYYSNFEVLDEASVIATFTEDFTYESDSTSFFFQLDVSLSPMAPYQ
jgi:hypothetical protein